MQVDDVRDLFSQLDGINEWLNRANKNLSLIDDECDLVESHVDNIRNCVDADDDSYIWAELAYLCNCIDRIRRLEQDL